MVVRRIRHVVFQINPFALLGLRVAYKTEQTFPLTLVRAQVTVRLRAVLAKHPAVRPDSESLLGARFRPIQPASAESSAPSTMIHTMPDIAPAAAARFIVGIPITDCSPRQGCPLRCQTRLSRSNQAIKPASCQCQPCNSRHRATVAATPPRTFRPRGHSPAGRVPTVTCR